MTALSEGRQPDADDIEDTGYLMRTTAVYGNGKFGIADRAVISERVEFAAPFRAEMLTVYLIRAFTVDLVEHMATLRDKTTAVTLAPPLRRRLGIGNATGLGMAPFLVRHPALIHRWIAARETALARVRALPVGEPRLSARPSPVPCMARRVQVAAWTTDDPVQSPRIPVLAADLQRLDAQVRAGALDRSEPWDRLYRWAESTLSVEGQEMTVALLIEPHGTLVDELADDMAIDETSMFRIDGKMRVADLAAIVDRAYAWTRCFDFSDPAASARFWYVSQEKLEPRLGERGHEPGARSRAAAGGRARCRTPAVAAVASPTRRGARLILAAVARAPPLRAPGADRGALSLRRGSRQPDRRRHARNRSVALQAGVFRRYALRPAVGQMVAHHAVSECSFPRRGRERGLGRLDLGHSGGPAGMIVSRNEIESLSLKAARGAGMSWGLAEEVAVGAGWLAEHALPWADTLAHVLAKTHTTSPPQIEGQRIAPSRTSTWLCPIMTGALLSDLGPPATAMEVGDVLAPVWLAPFLASWAGPDRRVRLCWPGAALLVAQRGIAVANFASTAALGASLASRIAIALEQIDPSERLQPPRNLSGYAAPDDAWHSLLEFERRSYVPASAQSRIAGAGAGLLDND